MTFLKQQQSKDISAYEKESGLIYDLMATCHQAYILSGEL